MFNEKGPVAQAMPCRVVQPLDLVVSDGFHGHPGMHASVDSNTRFVYWLPVFPVHTSGIHPVSPLVSTTCIRYRSVTRTENG
jgi:hypothetical protein